MNLEVNKSEMTILGVHFKNQTDFKNALYAISSNMIEGWQPTQKDVEDVKSYILSIRREDNDGKKKYDQYNYIDPDNLYTCRESNVLKNKLGISSAQKLQTKKYRIVTFKLLELTQKPIYVH